MCKKLFKEPVTFTIGNSTIVLHYLVIVGSKMHNLENENSDTDIKGVFTWSKKDLTSIRGTVLEETIEKSNFFTDDFIDLKQQISDKFNLNLSSEDDLVLNESRKFVWSCVKSDLNLLDMLFANNNLVIFETVSFNNLRLKGQTNLIDFNSAKSRFKGMADNTLNRYKKKPSLFKDLARAFHSLFVIKELLLTGKYDSKLTGEKRDFILSLKNNNFKLSGEQLQEKFDFLMNEVINIEPPENKLLSIEDSNEYLIDLFVM